MTEVFLICKNQDLRQSLSRYLRFKEGIQIHAISLPRLPGDAFDEKIQWVPHTFGKLADWLESRANQASTTLLNALALIEVPNLAALDELDPIDRTKDWTAVVGMLVLAFPEIHWVLISPYTSDSLQNENSLLRKYHFLPPENFCADVAGLIRLYNEGLSPLFDVTGFRNRIRRQLRLRNEASYIPIREEWAIAIDEEGNYSYFNAYVAYRFGFRSVFVTSAHVMATLLPKDNENPISLSFEDVYLNFADRLNPMSNIEFRDQQYPALQRIPDRIFVTSGHSNTEVEKNTAIDNNSYFSRQEQLGFRRKVLYKPGSGVFDVWRLAGLLEKFQANDGRAPSFQWPPAPVNAANESAGSHSSPGRLLMIADSLIRRARRVLENAESSVPNAVYGATLALEAQEYLGHRTPTTSLDAIALKHQGEVMAECMFFGVQYNLDTQRRFDEIEQEMDSVGIWFRKDTRELSKLNAELGIVSDLVLTFRDYNQFSEEQAGLSKLRDLHRRKWFEQTGSWAGPIHVFRWPINFFRWYVDKLLGSIPRFIGALVVWILVFGLVYSWINDHSIRHTVESNTMHGIEDAIAAFFGMQPPHDLLELEKVGAAMVWFTMFIIVMGFVHLGIFVSHLYAMMSRR